MADPFGQPYTVPPTLPIGPDQDLDRLKLRLGDLRQRPVDHRHMVRSGV
jgi:hypothetical protein